MAKAITDAEGNVIGVETTQGGVRRLMSLDELEMMAQGGGGRGGGGGGGFDVGRASDAALAVNDMISASNMNRIRDRARELRRDSHKIKQKIADLSDSASVAELRDLIVEKADIDEKLEREELDFIDVVQRKTVVDAVGAGARFVGNIRGYSGSGGGSISTDTVVLAVGGLVLADALFDDRRDRR